MKLQQLWHLCFMFTVIFFTLLSFMCSEISGQELHLESRVFVAFTGEDLLITGNLRKPANQTSDFLTCFSPFHHKIYSLDIAATAGSHITDRLHLELKNLSISGEYYCQYKNTRAYWFLQVRAEGFWEPVIFDYTEFIIVAVFTGVLLVFSVAGSLYVFRGHWPKKCGHKSRKQKQDQEEKEANKEEEDQIDVVASQSSSFYASLEPRPRSIYDVLDHSAAKEQKNQSKAKPKKKDLHKAVQKNNKQPEEVVFESVYVNF